MASLQKGTILGNTYEIVGKIGAGGGGIIYKARHINLQTDVVVKKIKDEVKGKMKTRREADILKKLKHPYLPRVYDFIENEEGVFTVMDYIKGRDLGAAVKEHGKYSQKKVKKWAVQMGEALSYLHSQNPPIIHSDIKPGNIMLTPEGDICLIDFNISLAIDGANQSVIGISAGYSPPEQYRSPALYKQITQNYEMSRMNAAASKAETEALDEDKTMTLAGTRSQTVHKTVNETSKYVSYIGKGIDARSDIYSLGVTLFFLLTGSAPSPDFDACVSIRQMGIPVSEGFAMIIDRMMEIAPEDRYSDGSAFLHAVRNCHKLDKRYVAMHRKRLGIRAAALVSAAAGIIAVFGGMHQTRREVNSAYYQCLGEAQEAMALCNYDTAGIMIDKAMALLETRIDAYREEVYLLYQSGEYENCISTGEQYISTAPFLISTAEDSALLGDMYYLVGNAYYENGDYANARIMIENALEYNQGNGLYYRDYALTLAKLGQTDQAAEQLEVGIRLGLAEASVYMAQGEIAHVRGQLNEAADYLERTITLTDDQAMKKRAAMLCVEVYRAMGSSAVDREIAFLEQYAGQFEDNGNLVMTEYLAEAYSRKARIDEDHATDHWRRSLSLYRSLYDSGYVTYRIQENLSIVYQYLDSFDKAQQLLLDMAEQYPKRYEIYKRLAFVEADRQQTIENTERDYRQMQEYYEKAKELYNGDASDEEMQTLDRMMQDLKESGWL